MSFGGIIRNTDSLGRIVIPKEIRRTLRIRDGESLEIYVDGEQIILKKYQPACIFCGEAKDIVSYKGKNVCKCCMEDIKNGR